MKYIVRIYFRQYREVSEAVDTRLVVDVVMADNMFEAITKFTARAATKKYMTNTTKQIFKVVFEESSE